MSKANQSIKNDFKLFEDLCKKNKVIVEREIILKKKVNNANFLEGFSDVKHAICDKQINFVVEQRIIDKRYGVKLKCSNFSNEPYFRFDSDGPAHRNNNPLIPLHEQKVSTPHFNSFDENGRSIAYKNDVLKDKKNADIIQKDINFGIALFCQESNATLNNQDGYPVVQRHELVLDLDFEKTLKDVIDNINFD